MGATNEQLLHVVTDIECDGPWPGPSSMLSFASVAVTADGVEHGVFEAVLEPLPGAQGHPDTLAWWASLPPEAWAAATTGARPPGEVMGAFASWVSALPGRKVFTASPVAFDGTWIDYYLRRFTTYGVVQFPIEGDVLFSEGGFCLRSFAMGVTGRSVADCAPANLPPEWLGEVEHTHRAIDDARGYAHLLVTLMGMAGRGPDGAQASLRSARRT